jgi:predicted Zn finger-like uncharacterized protein
MTAMKITCPECGLSGQVSDANIPEVGRNMVCPRCKSTFPVQRTAPVDWADSMSDCPDCGYSSFTGERFDICPKCGLVAREHNERTRQRPLPLQSGAAPVEQGGEERDYVRRELERLERDEKLRERQRAENLGVPLRDEVEAPPAPRIPDVVKYTGWACILAGLVLIASSCHGFYAYHMFVPAEPDVILNEEPPGAFTVYCSHGLSPTLQALLGVYTVVAGVMFLKMRSLSRKLIEAAVWGGITCVVGFQIADLVGWFRRSSGVPSFFYYFTGIMNALLMTAVWSAPLFAALWFLQGEAIDKAFEE